MPELFLLWLVLALPTPEGSLRLSLHADQATVEHGVPFQLGLEYSNVANEPFYIERPTAIGPSGLSFRVRRDGCTFDASVSFGDLSTSKRRFLYTPLFPGDRLETKLPAFNDLAGMETLDFPGPGSYEVQAVFHSSGDLQEGLVWPIWRGELSSEWLRLTLLPPSAQRVREFRQRLQECLSQEPCNDFRAVEYFRLVRDSKAAELLVEIFRRDYASDPRIVEALANQKHPEVLTVIREIAQSPELGSRTRDYFMSTLERLRQQRRRPCSDSVENARAPNE